MTTESVMTPIPTESFRATERMNEVEVRIDEATNLRVHHVEVIDGYEHEASHRTMFQGALDAFEAELRDNPEITLDSDYNPGRDYLRANETINSWLSMMPSAMALYPLQRPDESTLPNGTHVSTEARNLFRHSQDAIGIRTRAQIMKELVTEGAEPGELNWVSLACGAAVPVLDAVRDLPSNIDAKLTLVDYDPVALEFAEDLASEQGLTKDQDFTVEKSNLIKELIATDKFVRDHGEASYDMVDMLGIFEYFPNEMGAKMLQNAYRLVKPGGKLIIGNMLDTHPTLEVNQRAVGWPFINPRSLEQIATILEAAGIDNSDIDVYIPQDSVYAVIDIAKPEQVTAGSHPLQRSAGAVALKA